MSARGIVFSAPMVRALLDGRKTQTRRKLPGFQPSLKSSMRPILCTTLKGEKRWHWRLEGADLTSGPINGIPFAPGDRLWVREAWAVAFAYDPSPPSRLSASLVVDYSADDRATMLTGRLRSPIHMPRWASRLTLTITDVRAQRLQEISEEDAIAEGCPCRGDDCDGMDPRGWFRDLWDSIHGPGAWESNPWICAVSFTAERRNIDA